ncbi:arsenate reductase (glutaredoxin) [Salinimicrobium sediminilitoris]|uniref:arsenate reductase (glutaredoxin) n=1 Tax=Salinimicrobium sediminilitoris TaxID=2876715 RepID=UPI001E2BABB7|nr:arsenate reductase (glutaredoxin) [Salinimicrobium sediminilitoris]MCC8359027.1 arsenate reductase (glutaredoxin) [Salinimicrobium sediminilitoris]
MITIYHNTRCRKSREGLEILKASGKDFEIREYLKQPLSEKELAALLQKLNMAPIELVRTEEKIWKENYRDRDLSDNELIRIMAEHPKLIQRPVVKTDTKAVVGRPASNIEDLIA